MLALELSGSERFTVFVDHPQGVDHALCARVTDVLRDYLRQYSVEVSSPGIERPLRKPEHFARVVGRTVAVRTSTQIDGLNQRFGVIQDPAVLVLRPPGNLIVRIDGFADRDTVAQAATNAAG